MRRRFNLRHKNRYAFDSEPKWIMNSLDKQRERPVCQSERASSSRSEAAAEKRKKEANKQTSNSNENKNISEKLIKDLTMCFCAPRSKSFSPFVSVAFVRFMLLCVTFFSSARFPSSPAHAFIVNFSNRYSGENKKKRKKKTAKTGKNPHARIIAFAVMYTGAHTTVLSAANRIASSHVFFIAVSRFLIRSQTSRRMPSEKKPFRPHLL